MHVQSYLFFEGRAEEALNFYQAKLGAKVEMLMRYSDMPKSEEPQGDGCAGGPPPGSADKIMHSSFRIGDTVLMASDGMCSNNPVFKGISLSLTAKDIAEAERMFDALGEGGQVQVPLAPTFFSPRFGMVTDKFGIGWMVLVEMAPPK